MLTILIDHEVQDLLGSSFESSLRRVGVEVAMWSREGDSITVGTDAVVTTATGVGAVTDFFATAANRPPAIIVALLRPEPTTSRALLRSGATAILDASPKNSMEQALGAVACAAGFCVLPASHALDLAGRLDAPPRSLTKDEERFLSLAAKTTIEAAGNTLGLSRRQAQRRFRALCDDLNLKDHISAAHAAGRWGL